MTWPVRMFRLVSEPAEPGLCCRKDGLTFAGVRLLTTGASGFEPRLLSELQHILDTAYGTDSGANAEAYLPGLWSVSRALNNGDLARAMIASLLLKLPDVDSEGVDRLANVEAAFKANYNPLETRNWRGRWAHGNTNLVPVQITVPAPIAGPAYPVSSGPRRPKDDDYTFPPTTGPAQPPNTNTNTQTDAQTSTKTNEPEICPAPTPESTNGRTLEELLYQRQITSLEIGCDMKFNSVRYDGCDETTGNMIEAKKTNGWFMGVNEKYRRSFSEYGNIMDQAIRQSAAAGDRHVIWYFSDNDTSMYFGKEFLLRRLFNTETRFERYNINNSLVDDTSVYTQCKIYI